jgi:alcohol dehydrogenase (cytochrome c)
MSKYWIFVLLLTATAWAQAGVSYERLLAAGQDPGNWLMYSGQYTGQRFSALDQINRDTVSDLGVAWVRQLDTLEDVETTPLVVDGVMYVTTGVNDVLALDARTGQPFWTYSHPQSDRITICCGRQNRGVAILGDTLYMGTLDARLIALDAESGAVLWNTKVGDNEGGYSITEAPLAVKDMVIIGVAGGEFGIRGYVDAYDAATGDLRWRRYTIPSPGEPGHDTWEGDSWKTGGAPAWMTGSFDPDLNLIYWGTGNPGPDWNGTVREGDNLYSDCVLALDADTGEMKWYFQFTPHDVHDWDACQIPVLVDMPYRGKDRKMMLWGNRNAFFYGLDRETGEFLFAREYAKQTWAERIDETGRPVLIPGMEPSEEGTHVFPAAVGASNWWSPSYSPQTGLFYLMTYNGAETYFLGEVEYQEGGLYLGGVPIATEPADNYVSAVRALDAATGERKWEHRVPAISTSGVLATAGKLVFGGTKKGNFFALDAETGEDLWHLSTGGNVHAAPISYLVDGQQYVSIATGNSIFTFGLDEE